MKKILTAALLLTSSFLLTSCISQKTTVIKQEEQAVTLKQNSGVSQALRVAIARFENRSDYNNGVFANGSLSQQGLDTLVQAMTQSGYYTVMNRSQLAALNYESSLNGYEFKPVGARYVVSAAITEFGHRTETTRVFFGFVGKSKTDVAYATVTISLIDTQTSAVVASSAGTAQLDITGTKVLGSGGSVSYDSSQNSRVLTQAIREAVNNLITQTSRLTN
ncbi:hypothetical protein CKF54_07810 [Psittacicella hinzii]|uniref:Curli production assembly/transport component CsgG n=1 Tax=Psittacicella hinzii TaxID=2028575 RepID=A0A3A1Y4X4_9GAMM|nr:CsgG/HfaB family protein [Psittacicella hinzii]RIY31064.1 hypothetical protein CKF54_07810 [Psittacicella hinzii]